MEAALPVRPVDKFELQVVEVHHHHQTSQQDHTHYRADRPGQPVACCTPESTELLPMISCIHIISLSVTASSHYKTLCLDYTVWHLSKQTLTLARKSLLGLVPV